MYHGCSNHLHTKPGITFEQVAEQCIKNQGFTLLEVLLILWNVCLAARPSVRQNLLCCVINTDTVIVLCSHRHLFCTCMHVASLQHTIVF